jgi:hypothetical protein
VSDVAGWGGGHRCATSLIRAVSCASEARRCGVRLERAVAAIVRPGRFFVVAIAVSQEDPIRE